MISSLSASDNSAQLKGSFLISVSELDMLQLMISLTDCGCLEHVVLKLIQIWGYQTIQFLRINIGGNTSNGLKIKL